MRERGFRQTRVVPVPESKNPARAYSADEPGNVLALNQIYGPAEDAYSGQKKWDDENLTLRERGFQQTRRVPHPDIEINPKRAYSADEPSNRLVLAQSWDPASDAYAG